MAFGATETRRMLVSVLAASAVALADPTSAQATATDRLEIQARLAQLGYLPANAGSGIGVERTRDAILAFQSWRGSLAAA